jgi:hypothetical protein
MIIQIKNHSVIIDDEDYQRIMENMKWTPSNNGRNKIYFYKAKQKDNKITWISLHRFIVGALPGQEVDHINGNTLDNRKINLRLCDRQHNNFNMPMRKNNKTGLKGVSTYFNTPYFIARINVNGKTIQLGVFNTPEEAHKAYCVASKKYHGEFGRTQ